MYFPNTNEIEISTPMILKHLLDTLLMGNLSQFPCILTNAKRCKMILFIIQSLESVQVKQFYC